VKSETKAGFNKIVKKKIHVVRVGVLHEKIERERELIHKK